MNLMKVIKNRWVQFLGHMMKFKGMKNRQTLKSRGANGDRDKSALPA